MNAVDKKLTGRIAPDRIRMMTVPRPPQGVVVPDIARASFGEKS